MSQLLIKQKVFSWTDTYNVYDASGNPKYFVKADLFTIGHRIRVYDNATGQEIGLIQEKLFRILKEFEISINGVPQGIIKKEWSFFRPKYNRYFNRCLPWPLAALVINYVEFASFKCPVFF